MPRITLVEFTGERHTIDADSGVSLMQNAINEAIPGIDGDCGGGAACGTCHCFVAAEWQDSTGSADPIEESMLGMRPDRAPNSRLSCQIAITDAMDGMVVHLPEFQM